MKETTPKLWLVGAGQMAQAYVPVLRNLEVDFRVIGRSEKSAIMFEDTTGEHVIRGSERVEVKKQNPTHAIVAVNIEELVSVTKDLIYGGCKHILLKSQELYLKEN